MLGGGSGGFQVQQTGIVEHLKQHCVPLTHTQTHKIYLSFSYTLLSLSITHSLKHKYISSVYPKSISLSLSLLVVYTCASVHWLNAWLR